MNPFHLNTALAIQRAEASGFFNFAAALRNVLQLEAGRREYGRVTVNPNDPAVSSVEMGWVPARVDR